MDNTIIDALNVLSNYAGRSIVAACIGVVLSVGSWVAGAVAKQGFDLSVGKAVMVGFGFFCMFFGVVRIMQPWEQYGPSADEIASACSTVLEAISSGDLRYVDDDRVSVLIVNCGFDEFMTAANAPDSRFAGMIR